MSTGDDPAGPQKMKRTKLGRYVQEITQAELESLFHLPSEQACLQLRIGLTMLKRVCRRFGINRWPYCRKGGLAGGSTSTRGKPAGLAPAKRRVQQGQPAGLKETEAVAPPSSAQHSASQQQPSGSRDSGQEADTHQRQSATTDAAQLEQEQQQKGSSPKGSSHLDASPTESSRPLRAARLKVVSYALGSDDWDLSESETDSPHAPPAGQGKHGSEGGAQGDSRASSHSTEQRGRPTSLPSHGRGATQGSLKAALAGPEATGLFSCEPKQLMPAAAAKKASSVIAAPNSHQMDTGGSQRALVSDGTKAAAEPACAGYGKSGRLTGQLRARKAPYARPQQEWQLQPAAKPLPAAVQPRNQQQQEERAQQTQQAQQAPRSQGSSHGSASRQASASVPFPGDGAELQQAPLQQGAGDALSPGGELLPTAFGASVLPETPRLLGPASESSFLCQETPSIVAAALPACEPNRGVLAASPHSAHKSPRCAQPLCAQFSSASSGLPWQPPSPALGSSPAHSKATPVIAVHDIAQDREEELLVAVLGQGLAPREQGHAASHPTVGGDAVEQLWAALGAGGELDSTAGPSALGAAGSAGTGAAAGGSMLLGKSFGSWVPLGTPKGRSSGGLLTGGATEDLGLPPLMEAAPTWLEGIDFASDTTNSGTLGSSAEAAGTYTSLRDMGSAGFANSGPKAAQPLLPQKTDLAAIQRLALEHAHDPSDPTKASLAHKVLLHLSSLDSSTTLQGLPWPTISAQGASSMHGTHPSQGRHPTHAQPALLTRAVDLVRADSWRSAGGHEAPPAPAPTLSPLWPQAAGAPWQQAATAPSLLPPVGTGYKLCQDLSGVSAHTSHQALASNPRYEEQGPARLVGHFSCRPSLPPLPSQLVLWGQRPAGTAGFDGGSRGCGSSSSASVTLFHARPAARAGASSGHQQQPWQQQQQQQPQGQQFGLLTQPQQLQYEQEQEQCWGAGAELGDLLKFWEADEFTLQLPCSAGVGSVVPGPHMASLSPCQTSWLAST